MMRRVLVVLVSATAAACATAAGLARPSPFPTARPPEARLPAPMHPSVLPSMQDVVQTALGFQGVRYQLGGDAPDTGFDCSGFVRYVFASNHIDLPRTVVEQFGAGVSIRVSDLRPGDLLFFSTIAPGPSHVAIATGGHDFVHAPGSNGAVRVDGLSTPYWRDRLIGARRVL